MKAENLVREFDDRRSPVVERAARMRADAVHR